MMSVTTIFILTALLGWCRAGQTFSIRLIGGTGTHEGTVEYFNNKDEQYGAICDDFWDIKDADVVCRMLGFPGAEVAWKYSHFGSSTYPILYDNVECNGNEKDIAECHTLENWLHDCTQLEHAGVTCKRVKEDDLRMYVYDDDTWKAVYAKDGSWTLAESTVYCRSVDQMIAIGRELLDIQGVKRTSFYPLVSVSCSGEEEDLLQCSLRSYSQDEAESSEATTLYYPTVQCISAELLGGRSDNEGFLAVTHQYEGIPHFIRTISQLGARSLCMKMGFADVAHIVTDTQFIKENDDEGETFDLRCNDERLDWWEGCEKEIDWVLSSGMEIMDPPVGLVCKPYYAIASATSFDHWSMERAMDLIPTETPRFPFDSLFNPGVLTTTTTTAHPFRDSDDGTLRRRSETTPPTPRACTIEGSYDFLTMDDFRLDDCNVIKDERGPVGHGILSASAASAFLEFPGLTMLSAAGVTGRAFCAEDQCPDGFALAFWFTLPPCTKPSVTMKIQNGDQSCIVLDARSRIRIKANCDNDDGQITISTPDCSPIGDVEPSMCSSETLYSRSFTSTPFDTVMDSGDGCGHLIWNHVALNVHRSADSPMTCELFINGESEEFSCEPLQQCLSTGIHGLGLVSELGPDTGLDEVGLWRKPLSPTEVISLYHQPTDIPETFTDIPLWVVPLQGKTLNCPCEAPTTMDLVEHVEDEETVSPTDLIQISELLTTVTNMSDFTALKDTKEKHEAIQNSLDVISSVTKLSAKKAKESKDSKAAFDEVGHNILGSIEALQNALLDDVTIFNKFTSDEIEITAAPTEMGTDFIYTRNQKGADDDGTTVRISSKNLKQGARVSVALLKGTAAAFLPRKLARKNKTPVSSNVASPVINLLTTGIETTALEENITFTIPHNPNTIKPENASFVCSFYEPDWKSFSGDGCTRVSRESDDQSTTCSCNHMTSFAILMAVTDVPISRANEFVLDVITYTGCGLSIIALIFSLIVIGVSRLKSVRIQILTNQCVAMLLAQSLFVSAVENASVNMVACKFVAAFLHLFFLAVIFWMLVQGTYMYSKTTMLHKANIPLKYFLLVGWGVPVVIVGATAAININFYGMEGICWLNRDNGGIWIFVVPALVIALLNTVVMVLTVKALRSVKVFQNKTDKEKIKSTLKATVVLLPILGVTWITGILVNISVIFSYLFAIANAFQGLFLFIMQILINAEIRSALRLRKSRILPFNTSSIGENSALGKNSEKSRDGTKSTNNTTRTGVGVNSISGSGPSVTVDSMPAPQ